MAAITFRAKIRNVYGMDEALAYEIIEVPVLTRKHADMAAFRKHPKYGAFANSDLFPNVLARIRRDRFSRDTFRLDAIPAGVTVDRSGFLAVVTVEA